MSKGFTAMSAGPGRPQEIISSDGEVIATMKNGAEYVLRFGNLTSGRRRQRRTKQKRRQRQPADKDAKKSDVHRYLFVMARFNEDAVKRPELQAARPAGRRAGCPEPKASRSRRRGRCSGREGQRKPSSHTDADAAVKTEAEKPADAKDSAKADAKDSADKPADAKDEAAAKSEDKSDKQKEFEKIMAERKRIEEENQRKQDEYQATLKKGRETSRSSICVSATGTSSSTTTFSKSPPEPRQSRQEEGRKGRGGSEGRQPGRPARHGDPGPAGNPRSGKLTHLCSARAFPF